MATNTRLQRRRLYEAGAKAFGPTAASSGVLRDHPETQGWYVCPLCLHAFPERALDTDPPGLTIDEAPPKASSRGPISKVLTCRPCNNRAGQTLEGALKKRRDVEDFGSGALITPIDVRIEVGDGTQTRASATRDGEGLKVTGAPQASHPDAVTSSTDWWDRQVEEEILDSRFTIHLPPFHAHRSNVALLKAAYLAAFAAFGYRYIWRPDLDAVRSEIRGPGQHIPTIPILTSVSLDETQHRLLLTRSPLSALGVQIGRQVAFLPWIDTPPGFWGRVPVVMSEGPETVSFHASGGWPRYPEYRLDTDQSLGEV